MANKTSITYKIQGDSINYSYSMNKKEYWNDGEEIISPNFVTITESTNGGTIKVSTNQTTIGRFAEIQPKLNYSIDSVSGSCEFSKMIIKQAKHHDVYEKGDVWITHGGSTAHVKTVNLTEFGDTCYIYAYGINPDVPNVHVTNIELFSAGTISNVSNMDITLDNAPHTSSEYVRWKCVVGKNSELYGKTATIRVTFDYGKFGSWHEDITINQELHTQVIGETHFSVSPIIIAKSGGTATITAWTTVDGSVRRLDKPEIVYESDSVIKSGVSITATGDTTYTATFDAVNIATSDGGEVKKVHFQTNAGYGEQHTGEHEKVNTGIVKQMSSSISYVFKAETKQAEDGYYYVEWSGGVATITAYTEVDGVKYKMNTPTAYFTNDSVKQSGLPTITDGVGYTYKATFASLEKLTDATKDGDIVKKVYFKSAIGYGVNTHGDLGDATSNTICQKSPVIPKDYKLLFEENNATTLTKNGYASSGETNVEIGLIARIDLGDGSYLNTATSASTENSDWLHLKNDAYYPNSMALSFSIDARKDDEGEETAYSDRCGTVIITQIVPDGYFTDDPPKQITLTIYQNDKNRTILPNFEKLIITYELGDSNGKDFDSIAYSSRMPSTADGQSIGNCKTLGWSKGDGIDGIAKWGSDNTSNNGFESVYYDVVKILTQENLKKLEAEDVVAGIPYDQRKYSIDFYGVWYNTVSNTTKIILNAQGYNGGTISVENYKFKVSGYTSQFDIDTFHAHVLQRKSAISISAVSKWAPDNHYYTHLGRISYYYEGSGKWVVEEDAEQVYYNNNGHPQYWYDENTTVPYSSSARAASTIFDEVDVLERRVYNYWYSEGELQKIDTLPESTLYSSFYYNGNANETYACEMSSSNSSVRTLTFEDPDSTNNDTNQYVTFTEQPQLITRENGVNVRYQAVTIYPCNVAPTQKSSEWASIEGYNYKYKSNLQNIAIGWVRVEE